LLLTLLLHHPCLNDIDQALNLLFCIPGVQTDPYSLPAFRYSRRYNTTNNETFSLTVRSELLRCRSEERKDGRLRSLRWDGEEWDVFVVGGVREGGDQGLE
jgi:hypothetical protein